MSELKKINYNLGDVFSSKEELFNSFFTYFYNYLIEFYPESGVKDYSLEDFLKIAIDWNYGKGTMTGLANLFHKYYIVFEEDGIVENQSEEGFIGYCYKNNKYRSFIKFIITFFAYWRTDEDYSSGDIHGNDFFYNSWASLVDTCKFFYMNYETLFHFQRTKRLFNCFSEIDSVVDTSALPLEVKDGNLPVLERRGYEFAGWYLDSEFKNEVSILTSDLTDINLYPKWIKKEYKVTYLDENQNVIKEEKYKYQEYIKVDSKFIYDDVVENSNRIRHLEYTEEMPIINDIIFTVK